MKKVTLLVLALLPSLAFAQYQDLYMSNPNRNWENSQIDIHETTFEVHPKGTYAEVELFISFSSSDPSNFNESQLLEMVSYFQLDEDITVSDLWLWFGDQILVAHIIDRWTADRVYESIVNRQRDPAILFKEDPTSYELRVYPFSREQVRKIKMSFLIPTNTYEGKTFVSLPAFFHELANKSIDPATIRYFTEEVDPELSLSGGEDVTFSQSVDSLDQTYWETTVDQQVLNSSLTVSATHESTDNTILTTYSDSTGQYYSLSFVPEDVLNISTSKNVVVIFDYSPSNSSHTKEELLDLFRANLKANFSANDNFNFIYSDDYIFSEDQGEIYSQNWINGSDAAIDSLFDSIEPIDILSYSNLDDLLIAGFDFIREQGKGDILLISSSDTYHDFEDANAFSDFILQYGNGDLPKITIVDIQDESIPGSYRNGRNYRGNEYLYGIFVRESGGELFNYQDSYVVNQRLKSGFEGLGTTISNHYVYSTFTGGFSYGSYQLYDDLKIPVNQSLIQTGRYYGDLPLTINFTGTTRDTVFNQQIVINENISADSSLKRFWTSRKIARMEQSNPNNEDISVIIDYSVENRLMSKYTSFLSIEPGDTALISNPEDDGGVIISTEGTPDSFELESVKAYPNPFNPSVNIEVKLSSPWDAANSRIIIYNMLGQKVATLNTSQYNGMQNFTVTWDINQTGGQFATGVYLVSVETPQANKKIKITYLK